MAPAFLKGSTHKISFLQEKQQGGSVLHMTNALTGRISPTYLHYSWRWSYHVLPYHTRPWVEWFVTRYSVWLKVAVSSFLQNMDDMLIMIDRLGEYLPIYSSIVLGYEN